MPPAKQTPVEAPTNLLAAAAARPFTSPVQPGCFADLLRAAGVDQSKAADASQATQPPELDGAKNIVSESAAALVQQESSAGEVATAEVTAGKESDVTSAGDIDKNTAQGAGKISISPAGKSSGPRKAPAKADNVMKSSAHRKVSEDLSPSAGNFRCSTSDPASEPAPVRIEVTQGHTSHTASSANDSASLVLTTAPSPEGRGGACQEEDSARSAAFLPSKVTTASGATVHSTSAVVRDGTNDRDESPSADNSAFPNTTPPVHVLSRDGSPGAVPAAVAAPGFRSSLQDVVASERPTMAAKVDLPAHTDVNLSGTPGLAHSAPAVRHLEISVDDPLLGSIAVRTESRSGALHALISTSRDIAAMAPELQRFLKQHDIVLHTVSFASAPAMEWKPPSETSSVTRNFLGERDASSARHPDPQQQRNTRSPDSRRSRDWSDSSQDQVDDRSAQANIASSQTLTRIGSTLSIHI